MVLYWLCKKGDNGSNRFNIMDENFLAGSVPKGNLELLETMAMNKPTIATNYAAHTEFCNKDNCFLVDIDSLEPAYDGKVFQKQGNWAKIGQNQIDQTIEYMRYAYKNRIVSNSSGLATAQKYSWRHSAECLVRCI